MPVAMRPDDDDHCYSQLLLEPLADRCFRLLRVFLRCFSLSSSYSPARIHMPEVHPTLVHSEFLWYSICFASSSFLSLPFLIAFIQLTVGIIIISTNDTFCTHSYQGSRNNKQIEWNSCWRHLPTIMLSYAFAWAVTATVTEPAPAPGTEWKLIGKKSRWNHLFGNGIGRVKIERCTCHRIRWRAKLECILNERNKGKQTLKLNV